MYHRNSDNHHVRLTSRPIVNLETVASIRFAIISVHVFHLKSLRWHLSAAFQKATLLLFPARRRKYCALSLRVFDARQLPIGAFARLSGFASLHLAAFLRVKYSEKELNLDSSKDKRKET